MYLRQENYNFSREHFKILLDQNAKLLAENDRLQQIQKSSEAHQKELENRIAYYIEQLRLGKIRRFGRKTEASGQLAIDFTGVFDDTDEVEQLLETVTKENLSTETITNIRKKKTVGRRLDTSKLPREIVIHALAEDERCCATCGNQLEKFGEDRSEQLEYIPAQFKVIEHICSKYTCRCCETVKTASKPEIPLPKSIATPSLISEVIIKKFEHHLPWYRQSKIFAQAGIDIPANTIGNWFMQAGEILEPLQVVLKKQLNHTNNLQADETPVKVLENNRRGYMWGYHSLQPSNRFILFEYNDSRSGKVASDNLAQYQGILQTDGYGGYNSLRVKGSIVGIGCWAHCRRHFTDVVKISGNNGKAYEVLKWISKLYLIESEAREQKINFAERKKLRQTQAPPILQKIHELLIQSTAPPKSTLGKAIGYALNHWEYLIRYVNYGEAEIDNNLIENQIRPFALGRRNWLFLGNTQAANIAAFFYSLIQSCRLNGIDPKKYLIYVLYQANKIRRFEIDPKDLLPQFIDKALLV